MLPEANSEPLMQGPRLLRYASFTCTLVCHQPSPRRDFLCVKVALGVGASSVQIFVPTPG